MCKAKQFDLMCEGCQSSFMEQKRLMSTQFRQRNQNLAKFLLSFLLFLIKKLFFIKVQKIDDQVDILQETEILQSDCNCQNQNSQVNLAMKSCGHMIPDCRLKSSDPSLSSDFMVVDEKICGVADGVSQ